MALAGIRQTLLTLVAAIAGLILLPALSFLLLSVGPAVRVVYYAYLPLEELAIAIGASVLGASLAIDGLRRIRRVPPSAFWRPWRRAQWIGLGLLVAWIISAHVLAFPSYGSASLRDAWARWRIPMYPALTRVVTAVPQVQRDVGRVVAIAPTARDQHRSAREMNGDDMRFVLEVIGERGRGTFYADCTLDDYAIYDWRAARWVFGGREETIARPAKR